MIVGCPRCHLRYDLSLHDREDKIQCRCGASFMVPDLANVAKAWNCPNCGGATNPATERCDFCGVYLAFARCTECFSPVSQGAKFCSECGSDINLPARQGALEASKLLCPACDKPMQSHQVGDYHLDLCVGCGGTWVDQEVLDKILTDKGKQKNAIAITGKPVDKQTPLSEPNFVYRKCPYCKTIMHRRNFARKSGVIVDECVAHGIWFDKYELARVIDYAQSVINTPSSQDHYKSPITDKPKPKPVPSELQASQSYDQEPDLVDLAVYLGDALAGLWSKIKSK